MSIVMNLITGFYYRLSIGVGGVYGPAKQYAPLPFNKVQEAYDAVTEGMKHNLKLPIFAGLNFHDIKILRCCIDSANIGNDETLSNLVEFLPTIRRHEIRISIRKLADMGFLERIKLHGHEELIKPLRNEYGRDYVPPVRVTV